MQDAARHRAEFAVILVTAQTEQLVLGQRDTLRRQYQQLQWASETDVAARPWHMAVHVPVPDAGRRYGLHHAPGFPVNEFRRNLDPLALLFGVDTYFGGQRLFSGRMSGSGRCGLV